MRRRDKVHLAREHQKKEHSTYPSSGAKAFQEVHPRRRHRRRRRLNLVITPLMPGSYITIILHTPTPLTPTRDPTPESTPTGKPGITRVRGIQQFSLSRIAGFHMRTQGCHFRRCMRSHTTGIRTPCATPPRTDLMTFVHLLTARHAQTPQPQPRPQPRHRHRYQPGSTSSARRRHRRPHRRLHRLVRLRAAPRVTTTTPLRRRDRGRGRAGEIHAFRLPPPRMTRRARTSSCVSRGGCGACWIAPSVYFARWTRWRNGMVWRPIWRWARLRVRARTSM